jgi:membrane protein
VAPANFLWDCWLPSWAASNGLSAITQALNRAYNVEETRAWWKQRVIAVSLTAALSVLIITALGIVLGGGKIVDQLAAMYGLGDCANHHLEYPQGANRLFLHAAGIRAGLLPGA